jgi:hypothetical protein
LIENCREVRAAAEADDTLHVGTLRPVAANITFKFRVAVRHADERREMSAGGIPGDEDFLRQFPLRTVPAQESNRRLEIMNLRWKFCLRGQPVFHAGHRVAFREKFAERHALLRAGAPRAAVHPHNEWRARLRWRQVQIQLERPLTDTRKFDFLDTRVTFRDAKQRSQKTEYRLPTHASAVSIERLRRLCQRSEALELNQSLLLISLNKSAETDIYVSDGSPGQSFQRPP